MFAADITTRAVYDVPFGQFDALADGSLTPIATSFQVFLRWYRRRSAEEG
jgi:hypothetical protein